MQSMRVITYWVLLLILGTCANATTGLGSTASSSGPTDKKQHIIFITSESYTGQMGGIVGADKICQREAYQIGSIIPPGITFHALLVTAEHYPCDGKPGCSGDHASKDWPLTPLTAYQNPDLSAFNTVNGNSVFNGQKSVLQLPNGHKAENTKKLWIGAQSVLSDDKGKDIVGWASVDENPLKDSNTYMVYSPSDCAGFTSGDLVKKASVGEVGVVAGSGFGEIPPGTWGNYFVFADKQAPFLYNMWITSEVLMCSAKASIVCVS